MRVKLTNKCSFGDCLVYSVQYTDKKENTIFLIYKEMQMGSGAKSYMRKGFLTYEEMRKFFLYMRRPLDIYDYAPS